MCIDKILVELKIISKIEPGDKIMRLQDGSFAIDRRYFRGFRRSYTGDSRTTALNDIEHTISKANEKVDDLIDLKFFYYNNHQNDNPNDANYEKYHDVITNLQMLQSGYNDTLKGINNLIDTYLNDSHIIGRLSVLKQRMEQKLHKIDHIIN